MVDDGRRTTDGRTTDGRTTEHGYTISSPCEPDGSGELTMLLCKFGQKPSFGSQDIALERLISTVFMDS